LSFLSKYNFFILQISNLKNIITLIINITTIVMSIFEVPIFFYKCLYNINNMVLNYRLHNMLMWRVIYAHTKYIALVTVRVIVTLYTNTYCCNPLKPQSTERWMKWKYVSLRGCIIQVRVTWLENRLMKCLL